MSRLLQLARDIVFILLGKYGQYVITLVTIPITARALGVDGIGLLAVGTGAYFFGSAVVDFGLTQLLAAVAATNRSLAAIRTSYLLLRLALLTVLSGFLVPVLLIPDSSAQIIMIALGLFFGGLTSCGEDWIFIGQMKYGLLAAIQVLARVIYLGILVVAMVTIPSPEIAITCLGISSLVNITLTWVLASRWSPLGAFELSGIAHLVKTGWPAFFSRLMSAGYQQGAATIYSLVVVPGALGLYSSAEKVVRAASSALDAMSIALLPRMARREESRSGFWRAARNNLIFGAGLGAMAGGGIALMAEPIVAVLFGSAFEASAGLLRVQAIALPALALSSISISSILYVQRDTKGVLWAAVTGLVVTGGVVALASVYPSALTLSWGLVATEWTVALYAILRVLWLRRERESAAETLAIRDPTGEESK